MKPFSFFSRRRNRNQYYSNILISLCITIVVTIFIISTILYRNYENVMLFQIYRSEQNSLVQASYSAKIMIESVKAISYQMFYDTNIERLSLFPLKDIDIAQQRLAISTLNRFRLTTPFVQSIYIYNHASATYIVSPSNSTLVYNEDSFFDKGIVDILSNFRSYEVLMPIPRNIPVKTIADKTEKSNGYTILFYDVPSKSTRNLFSAIILNISEEWLRDKLASLNPSSPNDIFVIDKTGKMMISSSNDTMMKNIADREYIRRILHSGEVSGYFISDVGNVKSLVIYTSYQPLGWIYIRTIPYDNIMQQINDMKNNTLIIGIIIAFLCLAVSFLISKRLYKPIGSELGKLYSLEEEKRNSKNLLKQTFMKELVTGKLNINDENTIDGYLMKFDFDFAPNSRYILILLRIDNFDGFCTKYNQNDRNLLKFAVCNIASEYASGFCKCQAADVGEDHVVLLLNPADGDTADFKLRMDGLIGAIQSATVKYLDISVSATVSATGESPDKIKGLYGDALTASFNRVFYGYGCVIYCDDIVKSRAEEYSYPVQKEKMLTEALALGKISEVKSVYEEIMKNASHFTYTSFHMTIVHIAFAINMTVDIIEKNFDAVIPFNFGSFLNELNKLETIQEINTHFYTLFEDVVRILLEKKNTRHDSLIARIMELINGGYMNQNLSTESIADLVDMSPAYLGRLFRKMTNKSVTDCINEVRIEKAAELLLTLTPINEIVEKTGYTNSQYFYKVFKKIRGVTPNEYRQHSKPT